MASHFSILALEIPWTEKPGRLQSLGLQRTRHGWATEHSKCHVTKCRIFFLCPCCQSTVSVSSVLEILTYHFFKYCFSDTQNFFVGLQNFYLLWFCVLGTILSQIFAKLTSSNCFCSLHKLHDFKEFFHDYLISNLILLYHFLALLFSS